MTYKQVTASGKNEWSAWHSAFRKLACCDCGLVHNIEYTIINGEVYQRFQINHKSTTAIRREMKKKELK